MNKDADLIFEAYQKIYEAPIGPGSAWDDEPDNIVKKFKGLVLPKRKEDLRSLLAKRGLKDHESQVSALKGMKKFLALHDDSYYPGNVKEFREDVLDHMMAATGLAKVNAGYITRILQNAITHLDVISIDGDSVKIKDVEKLDKVEDILDSPGKDMIKTPEVPKKSSNKFNLKSEYRIDVLASDDLPKQEKELSEYVEEGMTGEEILFTLKNTIIFNNPKSTGGLDSDIKTLQKIIMRWVKTGVLIEQEKEDEEKEVQVFDQDDDGSDMHAGGDYLSSQGIDVPTADPYSGEVGNW